MAVAICVPNETPLTSDRNAIAVYAVYDLDGEYDYGVYPSPERARQYVQDWVRAALDNNAAPLAATLNQESDHLWTVQINGEKQYEVRLTTLRL